MRCFGLTPDQVLNRAPAAQVHVGATRCFCMTYGALGFAAISLLAYSIYAYRLIPGTEAMYSSIAAVYIVLAGIVLGRLVAGPGGVPRFALLFATSFAVYAVIWCAFWFGLKGKHEADLWGSAVGLAAMAAIIRAAFGRRGDFLSVVAVLFTFHTLGYYLGEVLHDLVRGTNGKLLWGVGHGLGFGAGLGYLLYDSQTPLRERLAATGSSTRAAPTAAAR